MTVKWYFPPTGGGDDSGFRHEGIEYYTGAPYKGLTREIIQNSLDASTGGRVTVEFDVVSIPRSDFPGADDLLKIMKQCLKESSGKVRDRTFFESAVQELQKHEISCLKIRDQGTTGLRGDYKGREGEWHALTKGRGVSEKGNATAGGSFGIGKSAPFAVSSLRTVFYATRYKNNGNLVKRAQGKSILKSHGAGPAQGTGFYGVVDKCRPIESNIPDMLKLKKQGSLVFITGFRAEPRWQYKITATVLSNFFYAIDQNNLEVLIQDDDGNIIDIDKNTLDDRFDEIREMKIDEESDQAVKNSHYYYRAIKKAAGQGIKESKRPQLGHCKMWILKEEGLPKKVALLRKTGMLITDDQKGLKRWGTAHSDFAGVFLCDNNQGNEILREMETPTHDAFEPERAIPDPDDRQTCKKALKDLVKWVKQCVDELVKQEDTEVSQIDELADFFPDRDDKESIPGDEGEKDIEGKLIYRPKSLPTPKPQPSPIPPNPRPIPSEQQVKIKNVRVVPNTADDRKKAVYFTPMQNGKIKVALSYMGDDGNGEKIPVVKVDEVNDDEINDGMISVNAEQGMRICLNVTLRHAVRDSIKVRVFQNKKESVGDETVAE